MNSVASNQTILGHLRGTSHAWRLLESITSHLLLLSDRSLADRQADRILPTSHAIQVHGVSEHHMCFSPQMVITDHRQSLSTLIGGKGYHHSAFFRPHAIS